MGLKVIQASDVDKNRRLWFNKANWDIADLTVDERDELEFLDSGVSRRDGEYRVSEKQFRVLNNAFAKLASCKDFFEDKFVIKRKANSSDYHLFNDRNGEYVGIVPIRPKK
jgi:hypothetical protein